MNSFENQLQYWTHMLDESTYASDLYEAKMTLQQREQFDDQLRRGIVKFSYYKKEKDSNGQLTGLLVRREAKGTLDPSLIPSEQEQRRIASAKGIDYDAYVSDKQRRISYMVPYWDLDAAAEDGWGWRQFHVSRFIGVQTVVPSRQGTTTHNGNQTYVHTNRILPQQVTLQIASRINSTLREIGSRIASTTLSNDSPVLVFSMQSNVPTLVYNYDITLSLSNLQDFRFTIEDVIRNIFEQYGVLIEKVKADINISWNE